MFSYVSITWSLDIQWIQIKLINYTIIILRNSFVDKLLPQKQWQSGGSLIDIIVQFVLNTPQKVLHCCCTMKLCIDLDPMDPKPNLNPVLTDATPLTRSRLGVPSGLSPYSPKGATFPHGTMLAIPRKKTGILDDFRSSGWLDAMKSSSPTHNKVSKDLGHGIGSPDAAYSTWLV